LTSATKRFSEENCKRTVALAFTRLTPLNKTKDCQPKIGYSTNKKKLKETKKKRNYLVSSSATALAVSSTGAPFAARFATIPSFVVGTYAPPVKVKLHLPHFQTPTLSRLTLTKPH
jgi:hypothetical protein